MIANRQAENLVQLQFEKIIGPLTRAIEAIVLAGGSSAREAEKVASSLDSAVMVR